MVDDFNTSRNMNSNPRVCVDDDSDAFGDFDAYRDLTSE